jgi:4-amino-4-deoxy-L-arabinose transferase-like glycosyltransferase
MNDLGPTSSDEASGRRPNAIVTAVRGGIRRLVAERPNPLGILGRMQPSDLALVVSLAVVGLVVRLVVLDLENIHMDEALYASYGLHISQTGDWFLVHVGFPIDQIPLFYWAQAIVISLLGNTPLGIRLVDLGASLVTIGAVYVLARDLAGRGAGWAAGLAMALSPFAILFGASVFKDPFTIALGLVALALARRDHALSAGVFVALALGGKLFGLAYLPLAFILLLTIDAPRRRAALITFVIAFVITAGALLGFMAFRAYEYGAPWFLSDPTDGAGGTGLAPSAEWGSRLSAWWTWLGYFVESNHLRLLVAIGMAGAIVAAIRNRGRLRWAIAAVCAFSPAYFGLLVVMKSPVYDRYIFYILPILCVVVGIGIGEFLRLVRWSSIRRALLLACTLLVLVRSVPIMAEAEVGALPVGPRSDITYSGFPQMCSWLQAHTTPGRVVWDQSLSWPLAYCLSGYGGYVYWYPDPSAISPRGPLEYVALTVADDPAGTVAGLRARGLTVDLVQTYDLGGEPHLWIYHVVDPNFKPDAP